MMAGTGMGQGVLGRYAPIKQMQGGVTQAMGGADTGAVPDPAAVALRQKMQAQPTPAGKPSGGLFPQLRAMMGKKMQAQPNPVGNAVGGMAPGLQSLMAQMRSRNPALAGR